MYMNVCMYAWLKMTCTARGLDLLPLHLRNLESSRTHLCLHLLPRGEPGNELVKNGTMMVGGHLTDMFLDLTSIELFSSIVSILYCYIVFLVLSYVGKSENA